MARAVPQVFTISPGADFAACVVEALLDGRLLPTAYRDQPDALPDLTIYVPTQRVRAALRDRLFAATAPRPVLLPAIRALGEPWDPLEQTPDSEVEPEMTGPLLPLDPLRRRFMLLPLVTAWHRALHRGAESAGMPALREGPYAMRERLALADALAGLIDETIIADIALDVLASTAPPGYDPSRHDSYWEETRRFLQIAAEAWPQALAEAGLADGKTLRRDALEAEAKRISGGAPGAFLVLGSTGSVPATARLMRAVARHDHGAVVLPGLDLGLDAAAWAMIGAEPLSLATRFAHAQSYLKTTLGTIGTVREAVTRLDPPAPALDARNRLISEALAPAESVHGWRDALGGLDLAAATATLQVIEAPDSRRESLAIATIIRETLETPGKRVALITPDRALAARVRADLGRWHIPIEDTSGIRLSEMRGGQWALLTLRAVETPDGASLLALLRHPDCRLGLAEGALARLAGLFDMLVFRQRRSDSPATLADRTRAALAGEDAQRRPLAPGDAEALLALAQRLDAVLAALRMATGTLADVLDAFLVALDTLAADAEGRHGWRSATSGNQVAALIDSLRMAGEGIRGEAADLREILRLALAEAVIPTEEGHPRAIILGPLEARLLATDRVIIAGMNEGTFPPVAREDPFLNRTMRLHLGLPPPERRIGQSAHDFQMMAGHADLILSRAQQAGEGPAQPSRFWRRLEALCGKTHWEALRRRGAAWLALSARLDDLPGTPKPWPRPAPVPAEPRLPARLSITEVETLRRDPFALYARHLLGLAVPDPVDPPFDARDRGNIVHRCLERYAAETPPTDEAAAVERLLAIGHEEFTRLGEDPARHAFWWRPFAAMARDFVIFDRQRRETGALVLTEQRGRLPVPLAPGVVITLSGKADRLEAGPDGQLAVFDYKTGAATAIKRDLADGLAPQLPITAAMALRGAFAGLPAVQGVQSLAYIRVGDAADAFIEPVFAGEEQARGEAIWARMVEDLTTLANGERGYLSRLVPKRNAGPGDYDHLARVREWDALGGLAAGEEGDDDNA